MAVFLDRAREAAATAAVPLLNFFQIREQAGHLPGVGGGMGCPQLHAAVLVAPRGHGPGGVFPVHLRPAGAAYFLASPGRRGEESDAVWPGKPGAGVDADAPQKAAHICRIGAGGPVPPENGLKGGGDAVGNVAFGAAKAPGEKADAIVRPREAARGVDAAPFLRGWLPPCHGSRPEKGLSPTCRWRRLGCRRIFLAVVRGMAEHCFSNHGPATTLP